MIKSPVAVSMGEEIRRCMRQKKIPQQVIADRLPVSRYVLSRMLKGSILFTGEQLEIVLECLDPGEENCSRWRKMCADLQEGLKKSTQGDNTYWRALREKRGLSLPMLSNRTGIKVSRLSYIESVGAEEPADEEAALLRRIFGVSDRHHGNCKSEKKKSEFASSENHQCVLPLLYLDDLLLLERKLPLEELSKSRSREDIYWEVSSREPVYAVLADCARLQVAFPGFAVLIVAERNSLDFHRMELRYDRKKNFSLQERRNGIWLPAEFTLPGAVYSSAKWSLPVLDMMFKPYDLTMGVALK